MKGKNPKSSWGIRVRKSDFASTFEALKPGETQPVYVQINHMAKLSPTPTGASYEDVVQWIQKQGWDAKPVRPLGATQWMVGFSKVVDQTWATWNDQLMLLNWLPSRERKAPSALVAGNIPKEQMATNNKVTDVPDPWQSYITMNGSSGITAGSKSSIPAQSTQVRMTEGPIEDRFKKQDQQISAMRDTLHSLAQRVDESQATQGNFQAAVKVELTNLEKNVQGKFNELSKSFEDSINKAMHRQDQQLATSFDELKAIMLNKATPPTKKAKTSPEDGET